MTVRNDRAAGHLLALVTITIWGTTFVATKVVPHMVMVTRASRWPAALSFLTVIRFLVPSTCPAFS